MSITEFDKADMMPDVLESFSNKKDFEILVRLIVLK